MIFDWIVCGLPTWEWFVAVPDLLLAALPEADDVEVEVDPQVLEHVVHLGFEAW